MTEVEQVMCYVQNGMAHKHHLTVIYCDFGVVVKSDMEFRERASIVRGSFGQIAEGFVEALKIKLWKLSKGFPQNDALFQQNYTF